MVTMVDFHRLANSSPLGARLRVQITVPSAST